MEEFFCHYGICLAQLTPYIYKVIKMLTKFAEFAGVEVIVWFLVHLFAPSFDRGMMLNLRHCRCKCIVVKMDDKSSHQFWLDFFYIRTEDVVANIDGFPEAWNYTCKCQFFSFCLSHLFAYFELVK